MKTLSLSILCVLFEIVMQYETTPLTQQDNFNYCLHVEKGNCQLCSSQAFLFNLAQDNVQLGLKAGTRICVQCPYMKYNEDSNFYCGDCLDNSQTWDKTRLCTYDYKTSSSENSVFHKITRPEKQLFYVIQSGSMDFTTVLCDGCQNFCSSQNQTCFPVATQYSYDLNNPYIQCATGYAYSDIIGGCDSCPENCLSCKIFVVRTTDSSGEITETSQKKCLICNSGFSLLTTRSTIDSINTQSQCVACFLGCESCYFGKNGINLNQDPWDNYNNIPELLTSSFDASTSTFYSILFSTYGIAQRCAACTSTTSSIFVPALNRKSCIRCGTLCSRCEYVSYSLAVLPTRDSSIVIEPDDPAASTAQIEQIESSYILRCRECNDYDQTFMATGTGCAQCTVSNCKLCSKVGDASLGSDASFTTLGVDFTPLDKEEYSIEKCLVCQDGYYMDNGSCKLFDLLNQPSTGCLTYEKIALVQQCRKCDTGYTLIENQSTSIWLCQFTCQQMLQDYLCQSCLYYKNAYRCQRCLDGFYVDMETGKCKQCMSNGYCKYCYKLSLSTIHRSDYYLYTYDGVTTTYGPYCYTCTPGDSSKGPFLNEDQRFCEKGGGNCALFVAKGNKGYCDNCDTSLVSYSRSSSLDDTDCIPCPQYTVGCRLRSQSEINLLNKFYDPTDSSFITYSYLAFKCTDVEPLYYLDTKIGRCIKMANCGGNPCDRYDEITIEADCQQNLGDSSTLWRINEQFSDITSKNSTLILENILPYADRMAYYQQWNDEAVTKVTINLKFNYFPGDDAKCFFQKDTYFTTNIRRNVFSIKELELKMIVSGTTNNEQMQWFIQNSVYFEYFTLVSLKDIQILPATDLLLYLNVEKFDNPFGIQLVNNDGSKFYLENVKIGNIQAEDYYTNPLYTSPQGSGSIALKKYKPFYTSLQNTFDIKLVNVIIQSQSYLLSSDITFQAKLFGLTYDNDVQFQYFNIRLNNVQFYDISVENQALFELQDINMITAPEWNSKIFINQVQFKDAYFINDGGFLSTKVTNKPLGIVIIDNLFMERIEYNNSRGIANFNTLQSLKIYNFNMIDSYINYTSLFLITTIDISQISIKNTKFTMKGHFISTQFQLKTVRLNDPIYSGLMIRFINMEFNQIICLTPGCLIYITEISNNYELQLNITMNNIIIEKIISIGFDDTTWNAATSAAIIIEKCYKLNVISFQSIQNPDLTLFYTNQVWIIQFIGLICKQDQNLNIRNNYCIFINNFYQQIQLINTQLLNLNGIDNSFIGISSWSNLVYNTSTNLYNEQIYIDGLYVSKCTITTTAVALPSSSILIDSTQMQFVQATNMQFYDNSHYMIIDGTLRPSNPTFLMMSVVGVLEMSNGIWKSNKVSGYGAVLHLEVGTQTLKNLSMENSNFDSATSSAIPTINKITRGGHLQIASYNLKIYNCSFYNSTAQLGGGIFITTLKEGHAIMDSIKIQYAYTPLDGSVVSRGGCMYIDSTGSELQMTLSNIDFRDCFARGDGGGIYVESFDQKQFFSITDSTIANCYALGGMALKVKFDDRTQKTQKTKLISVKITGNYTNFAHYFETLETQLTEIESYLFIKRAAAFEQDNGLVEIQNGYSEGLFYFGLISLLHPSFVLFNTIESQHSIISYRPQVEVIEPLVNPISIDSIQFRNITSISIDNLDCQNLNAVCLILQIRVDFPDLIINPALMLVDQILISTPLTLSNVFINRVICRECHGGLIQIMRVSNSLLYPLVQMSVCRCQNSVISYYGCFAISSEQNLRKLTTIDSLIGTSYSTKLSYDQIVSNTGISSRRRLLTESQPFEVSNIDQSFSYTVPNPSYLAHVYVDSLNVQDVSAVHGSGISFYGLTVNITTAYCSQAVAAGQGGCIYYEALPKQGKVVFGRLNIADSVFFRNNASIGGAIRVTESGINNWKLTQNTMLQNIATLYGNDVAGYPTHMGVLVNGNLQRQSYLDQNTGWMHYPLVIKSGQAMNQFENQTVIGVLLDDNDIIMGYQFSAQSNFTSIINGAISGEPTRTFNNDKAGFDYSNLIINFDPFQNITLDATMNSSIVNIPIYYSQYPYQLIGFDTEYKLQMRVRSVECERGDAYNDQLGTCTPCPIDQYVLDYKSICKQISQDSMNYTYQDQISLKQSYWRPDHLNDKAEPCINKKANCLGGYDVGNDLCTEGLIGALCEECDIYGVQWGGSFSNSAKYECGTCQNRTRNILMIVFLSIVTVLSTLNSVKASQERAENFVLVKILIQFGWMSSQKTPANFAVLMKIFNNHTQLLSLLEGFQISIPQGTVDTINTMSMPVKTVGNSMDCFTTNISSIDQVYFRLIWSIIMQIMYLTFMLLIILVCIYKKKLNFKPQSIVTMAIFMFLFLQPNYVIEFMLLISKRTISGNEYIQANVAYRYDTFKHDQWMAGFGVPGLMLMLFVIPIAFMYFLYLGNQNDKLDEITYMSSWGLLYHEYQKESYLWEFVKIFYRSLITVLICYFAEDIVIKGSLSLLVLFAYMLLRTGFEPYVAKILNNLDMWSIVVLSVSYLIGIFLYSTIQIDYFQLTIAGYIILSVANGIFYLYLFYFLFQEKIQQLSSKIDKVRDILRTKLEQKVPHLLKIPIVRQLLQNQGQLNQRARALWANAKSSVLDGDQRWKKDKSQRFSLIKWNFIEREIQQENIMDYNYI